MKSDSIKQNLDEIDELIVQKFPYDQFNAGQFEAIRAAVEAFTEGKKHVVIEAPTGVGKSVIAITIHRVMNALSMRYVLEPFKTTITTTSKGLQDQYRSNGLVDADLRSRTNYRCHDQGCNHRPVKKKGGAAVRCDYMPARKEWLYNAQLRTTNNAMLLTMPTDMVANFDTKSDLIVLDECHKLDASIINHAQLEFNAGHIKSLVAAKIRGTVEMKEALDLIHTFFMRTREGEIFTVNDDFRKLMVMLGDAAGEAFEVIEGYLEDMDRRGEVGEALIQLLQMKGVVANYMRQAELVDSSQMTDLIMYECTQYGVTLKAIFPRDVADYGLFSKGDQFLHMSATICGMDSYLDRLGISKDDALLYNVENPIPEENRIVNYCPVARMSGAMDPKKVAKMTTQIDALIDNLHSNDNGLIHTVSYSLANEIVKHSKHASRMLVAKGADRAKNLELLRKAADYGQGVVLLSPAMEEGYDLKGDLCRMCIVAKVPYEFMGDPLVKLTSQREPDQYFRQAILRIVQASGRGVRGVTDECSTYILDESFGTLIGRNEKFFPSWYAASVRAH